MHFARDVKYISDYKLLITFENNNKRFVDLESHLTCPAVITYTIFTITC